MLLLLLIKIYTSVWFSSASIPCHGWSLKELSRAPACSVYSGLGNRLNWNVTLKKKLAKLIVPTVKANVNYILPKIAVSANSLKDVFYFFFFCKFLLSKHYVLRKLYFVWYLRYCISRHENTLPMIPYNLRGGSYHKRKREILKKTTLYIT